MDLGVVIAIGVVALALGAVIGWLFASREGAAAKQTVESLPPAVAPEEEQKQKTAQALGNQVLLHSTAEYIAPQHDVTEAQEKPKQLSHRTHGGALPR